jgi:hypothetical protein
MIKRLRALDPWTVGLLVVAGVVLVLGVMSLATARGTVASTESHAEPGKVEHVAGTDVARVTLTAAGAERVGIKTAPVGAAQGRIVVPYAAVVYDPDGQTWTYTNPEPLVFVRQRIEVDRVDGDQAVLSSGPPAGTAVVTVGAAELYGTEYGVGH